MDAAVAPRVPRVRAIYGASLAPDATAVAHLVDDGGYPRAVQRFLRGWRASSSRDVELPIAGPVTRVLHSADGHWLACEVAPDGGSRTQLWVVTTDPEDRAARRIDAAEAGSADHSTAELIAWDGARVAVILTGDDGIGRSCLIDPASGRRRVLDRRSAGRLVDAWLGSALIRVGPRGHRDLLMLHDGAEIALLPYDPGSTTDWGVILDDHAPRRLRYGAEGEATMLYRPSHMRGPGSSDGYVRALIRSDNGSDHARLLEVTITGDGVAYHVVAERSGFELDEFVVSDDLTTIAMLWNDHGRSELQILRYGDNTPRPPIPLPGPVAGELSISAGGSMVALTVEDVADCAQHLIDNGYAEPERIGCAGWSYGGYLTLAALTFHPQLFAAGVSICGMSDLNTFYRNTEAWIAAAAYPKYGHPVSDQDLLDRLSPLSRVDDLTAPLLLIRGVHDTNVPVSESEQMLQALRHRGRTVEYMLFPDDGHDIAKRENRIMMAAAIRDWLLAAFSGSH